MELQKKRYAFLDIAKGLAIISVVFSHIGGGYSLIENRITWHLSVFFMVSGILLAIDKNPVNLNKEFRKSVTSLLKPYWILSAIYILVYGFISLFTSENTVDFLIYHIYLTLGGNGIGTLWFLPTLFGSKMLFVMLKKKVGQRNILKLCFCLMAIAVSAVYLGEYLCAQGITGQLSFSPKGIFWNFIMLLMQILIACGYISLGYVLYSFWESIHFKINESFLLALTVGCFYVNYLAFRYYNGNNILYAHIANGSAFIFCTVIGAIAVLSLSLLLERLNCKELATCGKYSLVIMTTHYDYKVIVLAEYLADLTFGAYTTAGKILVAAVIAAIEVLVIQIINHVPLLRKIYNIKAPPRKECKQSAGA